MVLGGYDRAKLVANNITWSFNSQNTSDLTVQLKSLITTLNGGVITSLLPDSIPSFLDSSLKYIWLPEAASILFEKAFNLTWNSTSELYFLDNSQHEALVESSPDVIFTLGHLTAGVEVSIIVPYTAFDFVAKLPFVEVPTRYLPLQTSKRFYTGQSLSPFHLGNPGYP